MGDGDAPPRQVAGGAVGGEHPEPQPGEVPCQRRRRRLVAIVERQEHRPGRRDDMPGAAKRLGVGPTDGRRPSHHLAGGSHLRAEHPVLGRETLPRQHRLLDGYPEVGRPLRPQDPRRPQVRQRRPHHHPGRHLGQRDAGCLGDERDGARPTRVGLEHPHVPVTDGELDVEQSPDPEPERQPAGQVDDPLHLVGGERLRRDDAGGVAGVDTGLLDMLHHSADVDLGTVAHRVHVDLDRRLQEPVDQQRGRREIDPGPGAARHPGEVPAELFLVGDDPHRPTTEHERRADQHRVPDGAGHLRRLLDRAGDAPWRLGDVEVTAQSAEPLPVLGKGDGVGGRAGDGMPGGGDGPGQAQRSLPPELDDHRHRALPVEHGEDVLDRERLEVEPGRRVVVGRDGLRVAVHHHRLEAHLGQGERGVHTAVVELDPLPDAVRPRPDHDDGGGSRRRRLVLRLPGSVEVRGGGGELGSAGVHRLVGHPGAGGRPSGGDRRLVATGEVGDLAVGEPEPLGGQDGLSVGEPGGEPRAHVGDRGHLLDEPRVVAAELRHLFDGDPAPQCLGDVEDPVGAGGGDGVEQGAVVPSPSPRLRRGRRRAPPAPPPGCATPSAGPRERCVRSPWPRRRSASTSPAEAGSPGTCRSRSGAPSPPRSRGRARTTPGSLP